MSAATSDLPQFVVPRPQLVQRLRTAVEGRLTTIVAPPGFGKSMLLQQWASEHDDAPLAWLSLDPRDNDGRRLAGRLLQALTCIDGDIGVTALERMDESGRSLGEHFIAQVLGDLELADPGVLVIDEVDTLTNAQLLLDLRALIRHAPPSLSVVVSTRFDPEHSWTQGPTTHLRHVDLAFGREHAALLLSALSQRDLSPSQLDDILEKTEGWPAGLQLFGLALRDGSDADELIERLNGADEFIGGYLADEVLARQPEAVRRFLLQTSVLRRLSGSLCEAVTGEEGGRGMLQTVERKSMFLVPVEGTEEWFRYHSLFRDLTRQELRARMPDTEPDLLRSAADWHLANGDLGAAMGYLIEARDWQRVLDLISANSRSVFEQGDVTTVLQWLDQVPSVVRRARSDLVLIEAILRTMVGATVQAEDLIEHLTQSGSPSAGEMAIVNMLRATWVQHHAAVGSCIAAADAVLDTLDASPAVQIPDLVGLTAPDHLRYIALASRARGMWYLGDVERAREDLADLVDGPFDYGPWRVSALGALALVDAWSGRLHDGNEAAARAFVVASQWDLLDHQSMADALLAMASLCRERGRLRRAELLLDQAVTFATRIQRSAVLATHAVERAALDLAAGDPGRGLDRIAAFLASGHPKPPPIVADRFRAVEARLRVSGGDVAGARRLVETAPRPLTVELRAVSVQIAVRSGDVSGARGALAEWGADGPCSAVEHELWTAIVEEISGAGARARQHMAEAVSLAEPEGYVRLFHDAGQESLRLLRGLHRTHPTPYVERILEHGSSSSSAPTADGLTLSPRELTVLRYLPSQLSNTELAAKLYVSPNTVKSHLRSIYRRLDASGRREAVVEAERRGLL